MNKSATTSRILLVAYACSPGRGSEESVGWDTAEALCGLGHEVTVLTRTAERNACPSPSERHPSLSIVCHDNPSSWQRRFDGIGKLGVEFGYMMWLRSARRVVIDLQTRIGFDSAQHVTYARYWMPSPLQVLDIPWILGPVGGGESIPPSLRKTLSRAGRVFEGVRDIMRYVGEASPAVRLAARSASVCLANTSETEERLRYLGARRTEIINSAALADTEFARLASGDASDAAPSPRRGFVSVGRLLDWKGFHLGLEAFAASGLAGSEIYTIIGTGPFEAQLRAKANELGITGSVEFTGMLPRQEVFRRIAQARALIHPSLHESGGFVCLEAMASGTPVVCIDTGGPGLFVLPECGYPVPASSPAVTVEALAEAMQSAALDSSDFTSKSVYGKEHVQKHHIMSVKANRLDALHRDIQRGDIRQRDMLHRDMLQSDKQNRETNERGLQTHLSPLALVDRDPLNATLPSPRATALDSVHGIAEDHKS